MARYTGPVCRLCRRAGEKLFLKGERCYTPKCAVERRRKAPGETVPKRRRLSDWGLRLREKQKARQTYGVLEQQFRGYYRLARNQPGNTGSNLLALLERRLDNVVYKLGFASSRAQARQWVNHGHFAVNGRRTDIPAMRVKAGDVITWREQSKGEDWAQDAAKQAGQRSIPEWLDLDKGNMAAKIVRLPLISDVTTIVDTRMIVEHYSR